MRLQRVPKPRQASPWLQWIPCAVFALLCLGASLWARRGVEDHALPASILGPRRTDHRPSLSPNFLLCSHDLHLESDFAKEFRDFCDAFTLKFGPIVNVDLVRPQFVAKHALFVGNNLETAPDHPTVPVILFFRAIPGDVYPVNQWNVYKSSDAVVAHVLRLRRLYPTSILVWTQAHSYLASIADLDVRQVALYMLLRHVVHGLGVLCYFPSPQSSPALSSSLAANASSDTAPLASAEGRHASQKLIDTISHQLSHLLQAILSHEDATDRSGKDLHKIHNHLSRLHNSTSPTPSLHQRCWRLLLSRKYDAHCMPKPWLLYPVLVTGMGGAGTHATASALQSTDLDIRHEALGTMGSVSWLYAVNEVFFQTDYPFGSFSKWLSPPSSLLSPRFEHVVHLVRNPLQQVSSVTGHTNKSYDFMYNALSTVVAEEDRETLRQAYQDRKGCHRGGRCNLRFSAWAALHWNELVEEYADVRFSIENSTALLSYVCQLSSVQRLYGGVLRGGSGKECVELHQRAHFQRLAVGTPTAGWRGEWLAAKHAEKRAHGTYSIEDVKLVDEEAARRLERWAHIHGYPVRRISSP